MPAKIRHFLTQVAPAARPIGITDWEAVITKRSLPLPRLLILLPVHPTAEVLLVQPP